MNSIELEGPVAIIPARFASSRFPGKPLALIGGIPMVIRVAHAGIDALGRSNVWVATDDERIADTCKDFDVNVVMTGNHLTGSDRVFEAASFLGAESLVNIQGDEPLVESGDIRKIVTALIQSPEEVHLGMYPADQESMLRFSIPKIVHNTQNELLFASRAPIPGAKNGEVAKSGMKQVAVYGYSRENLKAFTYSKRGPLEQVEDIEILRFLENSLAVVRMHQFESDSFPVDFLEDLKKINKVLLGGSD